MTIEQFRKHMADGLLAEMLVKTEQTVTAKTAMLLQF